ncbi:hypothetical protein JKP88DRAFT_330025 [Tribonema minus]|uniref:Uncharacterized protein n=1 Tax=Tribonema minus TaxID=303371 RepID=A0A836CA65_9STRA|nr:hypothetical protein JKP88DRAFT_330025 [Tribonema minus]
MSSKHAIGTVQYYSVVRMTSITDPESTCTITHTVLCEFDDFLRAVQLSASSRHCKRSFRSFFNGNFTINFNMNFAVAPYCRSMANRNNAPCDEDQIRQLLMMVATGVNKLREHPWLNRLPEGDGGDYAQQSLAQPHVAMELDNAKRILTALKAAYASSSSRPAKRFADRLEPMLDLVHGSVMRMRASVRHFGSGRADLNTEGKEQLCRHPSTQGFDEDLHNVRRLAERLHLADATAGTPACASAVLASEPGRAVWQMLGRGYWLTVASPAHHGPGGLRAAFLRHDQRRHRCGLMVDGHVLVGAAERGCEAALNQWHHNLSQRPMWRAQRSWVLPVMALRAIGVRERSEALKVLRWVFNTAAAKGAEVQLPPVLLTLLAFKCSRFGLFDTFRWLYTEGQRLGQQEFSTVVGVADLNAFRNEVILLCRGAKNDELSFIYIPSGANATPSLMDFAIICGQEEFVGALCSSDVAPPLSSFTQNSAVIAAAFASLSLLQWLHLQPACPFPTFHILQMAAYRCHVVPGTGADAKEARALEHLTWLRSIGAFQTLTQQELCGLVGSAAARYAHESLSEHHSHPVGQARIQWLQNEMGADWPRGGAVYILHETDTLDARCVVRMVSDLACPWGPWTSAEVRAGSQPVAAVLIRAAAERAALDAAAARAGLPLHMPATQS